MAQEFKSLRVRDSPDTNHVPRLLFLSNLIESKGVLVLLDALKLLKDKGYVSTQLLFGWSNI